jgi:transcriptional regulator with XRE-family HTH domain
MRERRIMLGLTQHQMAELMRVTYQQAHKYEKGINRIATGRLYHVAQALGVEVGYFFEEFGRDTARLRCRGLQRASRRRHRAQSDRFHDVTNVGTDVSQLAPMAQLTKAALKTDRLEVVADRGYLQQRADPGV